MNNLVYPDNREALHRLLLKLKPDDVPLWGAMTAQQMVEHLIEQVRYSYEKLTFVFDVPEAQAKQAKQEWIYTDAQISPGVILGQLPAKNEYPDLHTAIEQLMLDLIDFDCYFENETVFVNHGGFGPMDYNEWLIWHSKHFTHHLKQFGLIS